MLNFEMSPLKYLVIVVILQIGLGTCISVEKDLSMTRSEKQTLDKFKKQVEPLLTQNYMKNDIYLIRWLRARNFNLDAAQTMLKENLKWRKDHNIDKIQSENFDDIRRDYHATIDTYDKQGRPIGVIDIYDWDIRGAVLQGRRPRLLHYMDFLLENITSQVFERQGRAMNVTQWKVLTNCADFNLVTHGCPICVPLWVQFVTGLENHYPGWMDELIAIDAPSTVNVILDILRPVLSRSTREALKVFSPNKNKWMAYLDERISRSERRPPYGGTKPPVQY